MVQKKKPFRFRIPWLSEASGPRPGTGSVSRRPKDESKSPKKPDTSVPIQGSPFRPQAQGSPNTEPPPHQPPTTYSVTIESPRTSHSKFESLPSSTQPASKPAAPSPSQQEKEKMLVSEPVPQDHEPNSKSPLKTIPKPQQLTQPEISSQPKSISTKPSGMLGDEEKSAKTSTATSPTNKKLELDSNREDTKSVETQSKFHQTEEKEKVVHEPIQEGKADDSTTARRKAELHKKASASETQTKEPATRKKLEAQESIERKMMFATSSSRGKDINVVSSIDPATKSVSSISPQKPASCNGENVPLQKGIREDISKLAHKVAAMGDKAVSVITLAGDNRGATMQLGSESTMKEGPVHIRRSYPEESSEVTTDGEENSQKGSDNSVEQEQDEVGKAYVNSNIQSINNSLMFHGSITEKDPGVQLTLPQKTADYDSDNPEKPPCHGCKFNCGEN